MKERLGRNWTLHAAAIGEVSAAVAGLPRERYALILCSTHPDRIRRGASGAENCLVMGFADLTDEARPDTFHRDHAAFVARYLSKLPPTVTELYLCCDRGESRAPAMLAALLLAQGRSDRAVWRTPEYHPNPLVFRTLCLALGLRMPPRCVKRRVRANERAFRRAVRRNARR